MVFWNPACAPVKHYSSKKFTNLQVYKWYLKAVEIDPYVEI